MQQNIRYLFIGVLWLLLDHAVYTVAQKGITLADLPPCAKSCADTAAVAVGCDTKDISCLCSHQSFSTATLQCSSDSCRPDSLSLTQEVLIEICSSFSTTTSSTTIGSTSSTSATSTSSTPSTSQISSTSTTTSTTVLISPTQSTTQSASSTVVIVQTVVVAQPSTTITSGAGRLDIGSMGTRALAALIMGVPPLILVVAAT